MDGGARSPSGVTSPRMASDYADMVSGQPLAEGTDMSTTAELRELTGRLVEELGCSPHAQLAQAVDASARAIAEMLDSVNSFLGGLAPAVAAACAGSPAGRLAPMPETRSS